MIASELLYEAALLDAEIADDEEQSRAIDYIRNHLDDFPDKIQKTLDTLLYLLTLKTTFFFERQVTNTIVSLLTTFRDKTLIIQVLPYLFGDTRYFQHKLVRTVGELKLREAVPYLSILLPYAHPDFQHFVIRALRNIDSPDAVFVLYTWFNRGKHVT